MPLSVPKWQRMSMFAPRIILAACALGVFGTAMAGRAVQLPDYLCGGSDSIFADGYETGGMFSSDPSQGNGGVWPDEIPIVEDQ